MNRIRLSVVVSIFAFVTLFSGSMVHADVRELWEEATNKQVIEGTFKDVNSKHWSFQAVEWAVSNKITSGYEDGTFKPDKTVTEQEFLAMIIRAFIGEQVAEEGQTWSEPYYLIAKEKNYPVSGNQSTKIKRQYVAELIAATQGKNYGGVDAVKYLLINNLSNGKTSATVSGFVPEDTLTRSEAVQFIFNIMDKVSSKELLPRPTTVSSLDKVIIPLPEGSKIGKKNEKLEAKALAIHQVAAPLGYCGFYNGDHGRFNRDYGTVGVAECADEKYRISGLLGYEEASIDGYDAIITITNSLLFKQIGDTKYSEPYINEEKFAVIIETLRVLAIELSERNIADIRKVYLTPSEDYFITTTLGSFEAKISQTPAKATIEIYLKKK